MKNILKHIILFAIGGLLYYSIEILWRGHSHWSMVLLGGSCFVIVGLINENPKIKVTLIEQGVLGTLIITCLEFVTGCIVNILLGWNIWDYSDQPFNVLGQVCLSFTFAWFFISLIAVFLDDWLRHKLFGESFPKYKFWR